MVGAPSPITTTFQIVSTNSAIVGGSQNQGFIPQVTLQQGATESSPFNIYGQSIGGSTLNATDLSGYYGTISVPVTSWDLNAGDSTYKLIDANSLGIPAVILEAGQLAATPLCWQLAAAPPRELPPMELRTCSCGFRPLCRGRMLYHLFHLPSLDQGQVQTAVNTTQAAGDWTRHSLFTPRPWACSDASSSRTRSVHVLLHAG